MRSLKITNSIQSQTGIRWHRVCGLLALAVPALLLSAKLLLAVYAAAGDLDPSFGDSGKLEGAPGISRLIAIQADGKLLALSKSQDQNNANCVLSRFTKNGSPDATFGVNGQVETDFPGSFSAAAIALQPDGRIVVVGNATNKFVVARYKTNGFLDLTFSGDGFVEIPNNHFFDYISAMALQPNGKIVLAGALTDPAGPNSPHPMYRSLLIRLNQDGTYDSSFANTGFLLTTIWSSQPNPSEGFNDLVIQSDGKLVVSSPGPLVESKLVRFFANGEPDFSFGNNGAFFSTQFYEVNQALALQPDGKIVIAVNGGSNSNHYGLLVRLSADGVLDNSFGQGGKTAADPLGLFIALSLQKDGRLVVAGGMNPNSRTSSFRLSRYQSDGALDTSFGLNGTVTTAFSKPYSSAQEVALYRDGRIVAAGNSHTGDYTDKHPVMARYLNDDGTPAPADLRIGRVRIAPATINPGDIISYTIQVTNTGPSQAGHVTFTTLTPAHTTFQSFTAPAGWVVYKQPAPFNTGVVSCSGYELPAGSTVTFHLVVSVSSSVAPGTQISHASTISSFMPDPNETNNTATRTITVQ